MRPYLCDGVRAYPVMLAIAVVVGTAVALACTRRGGVSATSYLRAHAVLISGGLLGSKLDAIIEHHGTFYGMAWEAQNYFRYPGAIIALALAFPFAGRLLRPPLGGLAFADLLAPAVCWAMATFRIGCLLEGCCFGTPTHLPWAIRFPAGSHAWADEVAKGLIPANAPASLPVHPLELYFLLLAFGVGVFLLWLQPRKRYDGQVVLLFLALHEPGKFLLEFLRAQPAPHLQVLSLAFAVIAWSALLGRRLTAGQSTPRRRRRFSSSCEERHSKERYQNDPAEELARAKTPSPPRKAAQDGRAACAPVATLPVVIPAISWRESIPRPHLPGCPPTDCGHDGGWTAWLGCGRAPALSELP